MTLHNSSIIFVGGPAWAEALTRAAGALGAQLHLAATTQEALAFYVTYFPDLVVIEDLPGSSLADETYFHLRSVEARPLLILAEPSRLSCWQQAAPPGTLALPRSTSDDALLRSMARLTAEVRSRFKGDGEPRPTPVGD